MGLQLSQYLARSARYILQPHDNTLIRLAGPQMLPWEEGTEILNVSLTGLAFTAPADLCPSLGERIKIQFSVPERGEMACFALVVRLEKLTASQMLVAVKFVQLEMPQRLILAQALASKLKEQSSHQSQKLVEVWWQGQKARILLVSVLTALWFTLLIWFWFRG